MSAHDDLTKPVTDPAPDVAVVGWFVNKKTGAVGCITAVDDSFAYLQRIGPSPSRYAIPIADYDGDWQNRWRPATAADLPSMAASPTFRAPGRTDVPPEYSMRPPADD